MRSTIFETEASLQIFLNAPVGMIVTDLNYLIIDANNYFYNMVGYSKLEACQLTFSDFIYFEDNDWDSVPVRELLEKEVFVYKAEKRLVKKNNELIWVSLRLSVLNDGLGNPNFFLILAEDIDTQKKEEKNLEKLLLEKEKAIQHLNDFAHVVSHDLKASLHKIGGLAEWLVSDYSNQLDAEGEELIATLVDSVQKMKHLINGILQYSKVEHRPEEISEVELNSVVAEIINTIGPPENIQIINDRELPPIIGGKTRIEQVFQNLISNAVKFMDKANGEIRIGYEEQDDFWKFHVSDNGPGIDEQYLSEIFQMFYTLNTSSDFDSTGIGLAIVKKIIEGYGGKIWAESEVRIGTTFYFTWPK